MPLSKAVSPAKDGTIEIQHRVGEHNPRGSFFFHNQTRLVVLALCTLCLTLLHSNTLTLNFTVICMDDVIASQRTNSSDEPHWLESPSRINTLFSAIAAGALIGTFPIMPLVSRIGMRRTLTIYGLNSAIATLILPLTVKLGYEYVLVMRIFQGFSTGIAFSAMGAIVAQWSRLSEAGTYISVLSIHVQLCSIVTMPMAGLLCGSAVGWRSLYYIHGIVSLLAYAVFFFFYEDSPSFHRNVSKKELSQIQLNKTDLGVNTHEPVPYKHIIRDPCILGVWSSITGANLGFFSIFYYGPVYVNKVLHLDVQATGFATALPFILSATVKLIAGPISDRSICISERTRILIFTSMSQGFLAVFFLMMALTESATVAQVSYTAAIVFSGFNVVGSVKCSQLRARQHTHFVMAVVSCNASTITLLLPFVVTMVCPDNTREQWSRLFFGISAIVVIVNLPFLFLARTDPAPWTTPGFVTSQKEVADKKLTQATNVPYDETGITPENEPDPVKVC